MRTEVTPCICCDHDPNCGDSVYYGMPQFKVTSDMQFFECYCPHCGRGGLKQHKSAYLAIKDWNKMQERLREWKKAEEEDNITGLLFCEGNEEAGL